MTARASIHGGARDAMVVLAHDIVRVAAKHNPDLQFIPGLFRAAKRHATDMELKDEARVFGFVSSCNVFGDRVSLESTFKVK